MTILVVHLSDVHIKSDDDLILQRADDIASATFSWGRTAEQILIAISGDIAFSGKDFQYRAAETFISRIRSAITDELGVPPVVLVTPGNHDCDFDDSDGARDILISVVTSANPPHIDDSVITACTRVQNAYFDFALKVRSGDVIAEDRLWTTTAIQASGSRILVDCLNLSWVSKVRESPGTIYFPLDRYAPKERDDVGLRIVVMHHPLNWISQSAYRPLRTFLRRLGDIIITGHEHEGNVGVTEDAEGGEEAFFEGCALQAQSADLSNSSFNLVSIDLESEQFKAERYTWNGSIYAPSKEESWAKPRRLPRKHKGVFEISTEFAEQLDDPGPYFAGREGRPFALEDIYVYPTIRKLMPGGGQGSRLDSATLVKPKATANGVVLEGDEKSGRTSLLYRLYRAYHARNFVPVFVKGREFSKATDERINDIVSKAVTFQYGGSSVESHAQLPKSKKIILVDDFDEARLNADQKCSLVRILREHFEHVVLAVGQTFETRKLVDGVHGKSIAVLDYYVLEEFGYLLRGKLIEKWLVAVHGSDIEESDILARRDRVERITNTAMIRSVVPAVPIYLLTLLQSIEAGRSGEFRESALGYYYQYLLTQALSNAGVMPDKLTELFQYCSHLAWFFHSQRTEELDDHDLRRFNQQFSEGWHTVDFGPMLDTLVRARILKDRSGQYSFRYPYIYYYLKGHYLSKNMAQPEIVEYVRKCCNHLYVRENANTVLFLAHHTNEENVLGAIFGALKTLFSQAVPVALEGDTSGISTLIQEAPKLIYSGTTPAKAREMRNKFQDATSAQGDGLADAEELSSSLSLAAQVSMLFKTIEILGQILKNQYATIPRPRKVEVITELFNGPMRALGDFFTYVQTNPAAIVLTIEAALDRMGVEEKRHKEMAKKIAATLVQGVGWAFIARTAEAVRSDNLMEDIQSVVERNKSMSFRLIKICADLDSPRALPRKKLLKLRSDAACDMMAARILEMIVMHRLYMFRTTERDMQWLSNQFGMDLGSQHRIAYQPQLSRRVK